MESKLYYTVPAVRVFNSEVDRHFLVSTTTDFSGGNIDDATEEEWTY